MEMRFVWGVIGFSLLLLRFWVVPVKAGCIGACGGVTVSFGFMQTSLFLSNFLCHVTTPSLHMRCVRS
jgi:hypothetical protein